MTSHPAWVAAGWTMIHVGWVGLAIAFVAAIGRRMLRSARPEARYALALAALLGLATSPVVVFARVYEPGPRPVAGLPPKALAFKNPTPIEAEASRERIEIRIAPRSAARPPSPSFLATLDGLVPYLPWGWMAGSIASMAYLATGLVGVERLRRAGIPVEPGGEVDRRCRALARSIGVASRVGVATCERLAGPVLVGFFRPMILLPASALDLWTWDQVEMALLHELAHLRRWDNHINMLQRVVESLLFFHPAAPWLSGWARLERELCCDRLVVERLGRPVAYASMLAGLAGGRPIATPLGMANHQVMTRIRWILDPKDRPMTMSLPEGLGLVAATLVGLGLAVGTHARPPENPSEPVKLALRKAVADVDDGKRNPRRSSVLAEIADIQAKLGDRDAAIATLARAVEAADRPATRPGAEKNRIVELAQVAQARRAIGDLDGARLLLDRVASAAETVKPPRLIDRAVAVVGFLKAAATDGDVDFEDEDPNVNIGMFRAQMIAAVAEERIKLGDVDEARKRARQAVELIRGESGPVASLYLGYMPPVLARAGDVAGAREIIEGFRKAALAMEQAEERGTKLCYLAKSLAEIGDVGPAVALARSLETSKLRVGALRLVAEGLAEHDDEHPGTNVDFGGIKIIVGAEGRKPKDRDLARRALPEVARAVVELGADVPLKQARVLTSIAHLQAMAGDLDGAKATALSIPAVERPAGSTPPDGLYEAIKPATLALVAGLAGDADLFRQAVDLARAIEPDDQSIVARLVIAREQAARGRKADALAGLAELAPIALRQAEPRRSRALAMVAREQVAAGDLAAAASTADAIRDYPGLEKHQALGHLATALKKSGDKPGEAKALREALRVVQAEKPEHPSMGTAVCTLRQFGPTTFVDPDLEFDQAFADYHRRWSPTGLMVRLGDAEGAIRLARALPADRRDAALTDVADSIAAAGDIRAALDLAQTLGTPEGRLEALERVARTVDTSPVEAHEATLIVK